MYAAHSKCRYRLRKSRFYGAHHRLFIIAGEDLGVNESRSVLVKLYTFGYELLIMRPRQPVGVFLCQVCAEVLS